MMVLSASEGQRKENMVSKGALPLRTRRRSKGTIAGFASKTSGPEQDHGPETTDSSHNSPVSGSVLQQQQQPLHADSSSSGATSTTLAIHGSSQQKPCHSARLALLCTQTAISLGARTQLSLCPPGRNRRTLQAAMRTRRRTNRSMSLLRNSIKANAASSYQGDSTLDAYYGLENIVGPEALANSDENEEDYLLSTTTFDVESDEEASSGDEDGLDDVDHLLAEHPAAPPSALDNDKKYETLNEPLFTPAGTDPSVSNPATTMNAMGSASSGKLPFNHRKIRYFDSVTAAERRTARFYLTQELRKSKKRDGVLLSRHLRRMQRQEKRRLQFEKGEKPDSEEDDTPNAREEAALNSGVSRFNGELTGSMSAALLLESLTINPIESVEGMAKCYDGIVAAGVALLDMDDGSMAAGEDGKPKAGRAEVLAALAPLLISSLEQPSGEVLLQLATLRRLCGTARYQRRFVQRIAPSLIRPARGAMWCLRHQHDMEPILAAAELIFDSAHDIFSSGWYERGRQLLADSVRKETLNNAAQQLRDLSQENSGFGLSSHGHRRKLMKSGGTKDPNGSSALAEWEVIAVDRQIRISITHILSKDWSNVSVPARDAELAARNRRTPSASDRRARSGQENTHKAMSSPRSPSRPKSTKSVLSPQAKFNPPPSDAIESAFGPSFGSQPVDVPSSPTGEVKSSMLQEFGATVTKTPPRSPASPPNTPASASTIASTTRELMRSPPPTHSDPLLQPPPMSNSAPLSPQSSVGNASVASDAPYHRASSNASVASTGSASSQPAHYRTLTSTAAERKRTVAACRALRSQIQRFEEAFVQLHGRPPKGAAERAPLATTYAQYREWKRAIRADAACRIQALFRGARTRWILLRSGNSRFARVVMTRAGRKSFGKPESQKGQTSRAVNSLSDLSIPNEIGSEPERIGLAPMPHQKQAPSDNVGVDVFISSPQSASSPVGPSTPPVWSTSVPQPRRGGERDVFPSPPTSFTPSPPGASNSGAEVVHLTLAEIQARKRDLKQQLKQYDMNFARKHGRMPVKAEKEPIRHLYETYNTLKGRITSLEQDGSLKKPAPTTPPHKTPLQPPQQGIQPRGMGIQRSPSPPLTGTSGGSSGPDSSGSEDQSPGPPMVRPKRGSNKAKQPFAEAPSSTSTPPGGTPPGDTPSQDLAALKTEKGKLHQMLRSYEKDFFKEHKRQVSSFTDIKPVASQYRRYKEIKKAIAALQQQQSGDN